MQAMLQLKPTTAAEVYCSPCREPREFISASNVFFAHQKLGGDNTTKVFEIHVNLLATVDWDLHSRGIMNRETQRCRHTMLLNPCKVIPVSLNNFAFS